MIKQLDLKIFKELETHIGKERLREMHQSNRFLDLVVVIGLPLLFALNLYFLGSYSFGITWVLVLILQGFVLQIFGLAGHELFTHRKVLGYKLSYFVSLVYFLPVTILPSDYNYFHLTHHRYLNSDEDAEVINLDFSTLQKKLLLWTVVGQLLVHRRKPYIGKPEPGSKGDKLIKFENKLLLGFALMVLLLLILFPCYVFFGYLLPLLVILPFASSLRYILEHGDVDINNPLQIATNYKTGIITRLLFFFDSGDCHLVHHLYPKIPFYNIHKTTKLLEPLLKKYKVNEHRSLIKLVYSYYVFDLPHRSSWKQVADK